VFTISILLESSERLLFTGYRFDEGLTVLFSADEIIRGLIENSGPVEATASVLREITGFPMLPNLRVADSHT